MGSVREAAACLEIAIFDDNDGNRGNAYDSNRQLLFVKTTSK